MKVRHFGYVRVSSKDQNEERQVIAMREFGVAEEFIMVEKLSGKDFNRPVFQGLLQKLQPGDVLVIKSLDRLGRDYNQIIDQWKHITKIVKADIVVIDIPLLDTRQKYRDLCGLTASFVADIVLQILSYVAEQERKFCKQRQAEGISAAKARGVHLGRPKKKAPENFADVVRLWERGKITFAEALGQTGLKQATFYRRLREFRAAKHKK